MGGVAAMKGQHEHGVWGRLFEESCTMDNS